MLVVGVFKSQQLQKGSTGFSCTIVPEILVLAKGSMEIRSHLHQHHPESDALPRKINMVHG